MEITLFLQALVLLVNTVTLALLAITVKKHTEALKDQNTVVNNYTVDTEELAQKMELYVTPYRYLLNSKIGDFKDRDGNPVPAWEAYMNNIWMTPTNTTWAYPISNAEMDLHDIQQYLKEQENSKDKDNG